MPPIDPTSTFGAGTPDTFPTVSGDDLENTVGKEHWLLHDKTGNAIVATQTRLLADEATSALHAGSTTNVHGIPDTSLLATAAQLTSAVTGLQPASATLTALAALSTTPYGRSLLTVLNAAALQSTLGFGTAATHAAGDFDTAGAAAAAQAASQPLSSNLTTLAGVTTTSYGRGFLGLADAPAARIYLALGTAATQATGAFDAAGAAAAAQAASQPLDSDLTTIAGLTATTDSIIQSKGSAWSVRTPAQFKVDLVLVKADVGLGNVDNTSDATKNAATATLTNKTLTSPALTTPTGIVATDIASGTFAIGRIPTGTTSTTVPVGGVITAAGPTGDASHTLALTYNAAGQLTAVTSNSIAIAASQVTSGLAGTYAPLASPTFTGTLTSPSLIASGLTGATSAVRWGGGTASAAPTTGTWSAGDWVVSQAGKVYICTAGGTPGTWADSGAGSGGPPTGSAGGDLAGSTYPNPTIAAAAVTLAKMANLTANSFLGNNTGSAATPIALTVAQAKTLLALAVADVSGAAPLASPTFTGVGTIPTGWSITAPTGLVKADVGLGNVSNSAITAGGPQGDASHTQVLTWNAAGQVTTVTNTAITIAESAVTGLVTDLGTLTTNVSTNTTAIATKQNVLSRTAVKTATTYTAAANELVPADTTSNSITVTLPTAPADKTVVGVRQIIRGGSNTVTISTAGSDVFSRAGGPTTATLTLAGQELICQYDSATSIWTPISDGYPLAQLDLRYLGISTAIPESQVTNLVSDLAAKAPLASPTFTGTVTLPAATVTLAMQSNAAANSFRGNNTGSAATPVDLTVAQAKTLLNYVAADIPTLAPLASPTFTGTVTAPLLVLGNTASYTASFTDVSYAPTNTFATTASMAHVFLSYAGTDTWSVAPSSFGMFAGFKSSGTFQNDAAVSVNLSPVVSFQAAYTKRIDTATGRSLGTDSDFLSSPSYLVANSGTFTSGTHQSFVAGGTLNASGSTLTAHTGLTSGFTVTAGTVTTLSHVIVSDATGAGTVTTQVGIDIAALSKAGTNIGIRNKASTQLGSSAQLTVDTSGNLSTSGNLATSGSGTLTVAGNVGFNGKAAQATTGWAAPTASALRTAQANATYSTTGGTGTTAGAFDTAAHRDNVITDLANVIQRVGTLITDLRANGVIG